MPGTAVFEVAFIILVRELVFDMAGNIIIGILLRGGISLNTEQNASVVMQKFGRASRKPCQREYTPFCSPESDATRRIARVSWILKGLDQNMRPFRLNKTKLFSSELISGVHRKYL